MRFAQLYYLSNDKIKFKGDYYITICVKPVNIDNYLRRIQNENYRKKED